MPIHGKARPEHARGKRLRPVVPARNVDDSGAESRIPIGGDCCHLKALRNERFRARPESRADQHSIGAEHQGCCEPAPVCDAAGGDEYRFR